MVLHSGQYVATKPPMNAEVELHKIVNCIQSAHFTAQVRVLLGECWVDCHRAQERCALGVTDCHRI